MTEQRCMDETVNKPIPIEFNESELENIKNKIECMNKFQHIEVLRILKQNKSIKLNENKNGVYVNISFLSKETLHELIQYIQYIELQTTILENKPCAISSNE